jgi:hypothetical protein
VLLLALVAAVGGTGDEVAAGAARRVSRATVGAARSRCKSSDGGAGAGVGGRAAGATEGTWGVRRGVEQDGAGCGAATQKAVANGPHDGGSRGSRMCAARWRSSWWLHACGAGEGSHACGGGERKSR